MTILRPDSKLRRSWVGKQQSYAEKGGKVPSVKKESSKQSSVEKVCGRQSSVEKVSGKVLSFEKEGSKPRKISSIEKKSSKVSKVPSIEKEGNKQSSIEKIRGRKSSFENVDGNRSSLKRLTVQQSRGTLREPSKRKAAKQHDPMFAYQQMSKTKKRKVLKQPDPLTPPSEKAKALSDHSSKKKVAKQPYPPTSQSEKASLGHTSKKKVTKQHDPQTPSNLRRKKTFAKQPDYPPPPSEKTPNETTPSDHSSDEDDEYENEQEVNEDAQEVHMQDEDEHEEEEDENEDGEDENQLEYEYEHEQEEENGHEQEGEYEHEQLEEDEDEHVEEDEDEQEEEDEHQASEEVSNESETDESSAEEETIPERRSKHRGRTKIRENADFKRRPKLYIIGDRAFKSDPHDTKIVSTIAQLVTRNAKGAYKSYGEFPNNKKEECLRAFLMKYRWGKHEDHTRCSQVFHRIAGSRYSNVLTGVRRDVAKKAKSSEPSSWKPFPPSWFTSKVWEKLCDKWSSPEWRKKSIQMRENRLKGGVKVYHRHGSSNSYSRAIRMENKLKRHVTFTEVYADTHMSKDKKEFLTERAGTTFENYNKLMNEKWGANKKKWPSIDEEAWFHASGGKKHGHFFGVPSLMNSSKLPGGRCSQYPVMGNILATDTNQVSSQYNEDDDDEDDLDYVLGMGSEDELGTKNRFDEADYDESSFDCDARSSDDDEITSK